MKKFLVLLLLTVIMLLSVSITAFANVGTPTPVSASSNNVAIICFENGQLLFVKNENEATSPAAGVKLLVAALVFEHCEKNNVNISTAKVIVPKYATEGFEGTYNIGLKENEELTVEQLLYALLVSNANDVAVTLANYVSGSEAAFVELMNSRLKEIGATNTTFVNVTGLDASPNNVTTALDMTKIVSLFYSKNELVSMTRVARYTIPQTNKTTGTRNLNNKNHLVSSTLDANYLDRNAIGLMYTYTESAGHCVYTAVELSGLTYLVVAMNSDTVAVPGGPKPLIGALVDVRSLFPLCAGFDYHELLRESQLLGEISVTLASTDSETVTYHAEKTVELLLKTALFDPTKVTIAIDGVPETLEAPLTRGQTVGKFTILYDGVEIESGNVVLTSGVERDELVYILGNIRSFLFSDTMRNGVIIFISLIILYIILGIVLKVIKLVKKIKRRKARKEMMERRKAQGKPVDPYYDDYYYDDDDDYYE